MKNTPKLVAAYLAGVVTALSLGAAAATVTITTSAAQDARLGPAFGYKLGLRNAQGAQRNATVPEVKAWLIGQMREVVQEYELHLARQQLAAEAFDPS